MPVPPATTPTIIDRTVEATVRRTTRLRFAGWVRTSRGSARTPRLAIVAVAEAIASGVARSRSWPIAAAPTARLSFICDGRASVLGLASGSRGRVLKPKRSAYSTSRFAPSFAPSGANTELHEFAVALASEPPQAPPPALRKATPESVAAVCTG